MGILYKDEQVINPDMALIKIANYFHMMETVLGSVDLSTRDYRDDYDFDGLPEDKDELLDWMGKMRTEIYDALTILEDALKYGYDED